MDPKVLWEKVYRTKRPNEVSWFRPHLEVSLQFIEEAATNRDAQIIDVGGGESTLVDDLLTRGYRNPSVLDVALTALDVAIQRLGDRARTINWLCGDLTTIAIRGNTIELCPAAPSLKIWTRLATIWPRVSLSSMSLDQDPTFTLQRRQHTEGL